MASSGDFHVDEINHEKRFSVYVKTSWEIFSKTIQEIETVALDKNSANPKHTGKVATGVDATVKVAGRDILKFHDQNMKICYAYPEITPQNQLSP